MILDAGCGAGRYLGMFERLSDRRFGVDISPAMARAATRFGKCVIGDIGALPFSDHRFDYVLSVNVLGHCGYSLQALSELSRVCKPGGDIVLVVPNVYSVISFLRKCAVLLHRYTLLECRHFTYSELVREGYKRGLVPIDRGIWCRRPSYDTTARNVVGTVAYFMDKILHAFFPKSWGECLVVKLMQGQQ